MRDLWGDSVKRCGGFCVFHGESEPTPNGRWLLIGLLFVQRLHLDEVCAVLQYFRRVENYHGEIHFSALSKSFGGQWSTKPRVARQWLRCYQNSLNDRVFFSALAVDRYCPRYEHKRFTGDFHAYNRFTAMALKVGITWHLGPQRWDELSIHFVSDAKDRASRLDQGMIDNFENYLPYRVELDAFLNQADKRYYPWVTLQLSLQDSASDDLLQLCDLLLGATQTALVVGASRPTKRELGEMVVRWCEDLRRPPWQQEFKLHRKFNLWAFPDQNSKPCNRVPLALQVDDGQASFL
jgi:hypothetical protein